MTVMRGSIVTVAAQRAVAGNLLRGQQRSLSQVGFQVNGSEIALHDRYRVQLGAQRCRVNSAICERSVESPLGLDDLPANGYGPFAHFGIKGVGSHSLCVG